MTTVYWCIRFFISYVVFTVGVGCFGFCVDPILRPGTIAEPIPGLCFFTVLFSVPLLAAFLVFDYTARIDPRQRGAYTRCRQCGYILKGISAPRCPECGEPI